MYGIYIVMTKKNKAVNFNMRIREDIREDFKVVAHINGVSASTLISQYMVRAINEEKKDLAKFEMHKLIVQEDNDKENKYAIKESLTDIGEMEADKKAEIKQSKQKNAA